MQPVAPTFSSTGVHEMSHTGLLQLRRRANNQDSLCLAPWLVYRKAPWQRSSGLNEAIWWGTSPISSRKRQFSRA